jgi:YaiO family outer membrane protein
MEPSTLMQALLLAACCATPAAQAHAGPPDAAAWVQPADSAAVQPAGQAAAPVQPAPVDPVPRWLARLAYDRTEIGGDADPWHAVVLSLLHRDDQLVVEGSIAHVDRGIASHIRIGADVHLPAWPGAYANVRVQAAPDATVIPWLGGALELFQVLAPRWEASALARADRFSEATVNIFGLSLAHFAGPWAARARLNAATVGDDWAAFGSGHLRRALRDPDSFLELGAGAGREVVEIVQPGAPDIVQPDIRDAATAHAAAQIMASRRLGARVGVGYSRYDGLSDRVHGSAAVIVRW